MPIPSDPKLPLRLAFSHKEKAEAAIRQVEKAYADKSLDRRAHDSQRASFDRERVKAKRTLERLLGIERARVDALEAQRAAALEEQLHLPERVSAGKLSALDANDTNRRLVQRLAELNQQLEIGRARLEAQTSEQLGGYIDLPFAEYAAAEAGGSGLAIRAEDPGRSRDWIIALTVALIASASVFLPWLSKNGVTSSLATSGGELARLAVEADLPAALARNAWVAFALLPFAGLLFTAGRSFRVTGWGFLILGLVMLAAGAFPGLMLGARGGGPSTLLHLTASFRPGALLYCACAMSLIVIGAFRVSPPGDTLKHAVSVSLALLAAVGGVGLLAALALLGVQGKAEASFTAAIDDSATDRVNFVLRNEGNGSIACFFPLPGNDEYVVSPVNDRHTFGMRLFIREKASNAYREAPAAPFVWRLAQGPIPEGQAVSINPGTDFTGYLDLRQFAELGVEANSARLALARRDGTIVNEVEVTLPERYLSAPGSIRETIVVAPPASRPVVASPEASVPETVEAVAQPAPVPSPRYVEFAGSIGEKVVVRIYEPEGTPTEVVVGPGDLVIDNWKVDSIERRPPSFVLRRDSNSLTVPRGQAVPLP